MVPDLSARAIEPELMDDFSQGGEELREALRHLRRLNRMFAASGPIVYGVNRLWAEAGKPQRLTVLDIGAGSGELNRSLLGWADRNGVRLRIRLADMTEAACEEARRLYRDERRVEVVRADLFRLEPESADIVTASQVLHHVEDERLAPAVRCLLDASRYGAVIGDIHRHPISWAAVWLATRLISRNRYIRHDGPLSVAKGFRTDDWKRLGEAVGPAQVRADWRPLFRYAVTIRKPGGDVDVPSSEFDRRKHP